MTKTELRDLLHSLADAWTRRDYAAAAGFFAEDVRYGGRPCPPSGRFPDFG
jgi:hypothetical protein